MRSEYHLIATLATSSVIYAVSKSIPCFLVSFISGFLIDLDHLLDYYIQEGISLDFGKFYNHCIEHRFKYLTIIFHSLELLFLLWGIIYIFKLGPFWLALTIGFSQHMLFDLIFNQDIIKTDKFYFLTLRIYRKFRLEKFFKNDRPKNCRNLS